jgi:hypothetical protein
MLFKIMKQILLNSDHYGGNINELDNMVKIVTSFLTNA